MNLPTTQDLPKMIEVPWIISDLLETQKTKKFQVPEIVKKDNRNTTMFKLSAALRGAGLQNAVISEAVKAVNSAVVDPPLSETEITKLTDSACRYDKGGEENRVTHILLGVPGKDDQWVRCLGHQENDYFFTSSSNRQIVKIGKASFSSQVLLDLMAYEFWKTRFPAKSTFDQIGAASYLMLQCRKAGIFSYRNIRGRGLWKDRKKYVFHTGNTIVDIQSQRTWSVGGFETKYIYALSEDVGCPGQKIRAPETSLTEIAESFTWKNKSDAKLLMGWIALSRLSGALRWRPHIWISGAKGTGKSTIIDQFIRPLLGPQAAFFEGDTTAPGIRQFMRCDSLPIIFDEAETTGTNPRRIKNVLELARQASSDNEAYICKGTVDGKGHHYKMGSMFCMASIRVALQEEQDRSRFCILELSSGGIDNWRSVEKKLASVNYEAGEWVLSKMLENLEALEKTIDLISDEMASGGLTRRLCDQYGTLLAGYFVLTYGRVPKNGEIGKLIGEIDFEGLAEDVETTDSQECLDTIMQSKVLWDSATGVQRNSVYELTEMARKDPAGSAARELNRTGIDVTADMLFVSTAHPELNRLLRGSLWGERLWAKSLLRIDGAEKCRRRIASRNPIWCVRIPN